MGYDFLFITITPGLVLIDVPFSLGVGFITFCIYFFGLSWFINFVLGVLKRIPFL